ncbi:MAG TPA: metalloregulator ArsR/SmtB family transcription factor [Thermomicrobiales bacterium]|nr:metalloregulator ArsR/SmtB family transcription factor [Thermomicrobiales bacterium]
MGELVVGTPTLRMAVQISLPLDLVSVCSLLYRAVPGSGLDPWLVATRRALSPSLRADLNVLHGFSGRLLYYMEEPVMAFEPLREDRLDAGFDDLIAFLEDLPPSAYREMASHAIARVHRDLGNEVVIPADGDELAWRRFIEAGLTTTTADEVMPLIMHPSDLRERTIRLYREVWENHYADEFRRRLPAARRAVDIARTAESRGFSLAFSDLTGNRLPVTLLAGLNTVSAVTFCPSAHLGSFVSYILYPPNLIVFFSVPGLEARTGDGAFAPPSALDQPRDGGTTSLSEAMLLEALRALADPSRLRIVDLLRDGELYAQEIVARLGVAQSAVSRHLAQLERAGVITVRPGRGVKYYAINADRMRAVGIAIAGRVNGAGVTRTDDAAD